MSRRNFWSKLFSSRPAARSPRKRRARRSWNLQHRNGLARKLMVEGLETRICLNGSWATEASQTFSAFSWPVVAIRLLSGLHTSIYSEGIAEVVIPGSLLQEGENRITFTARDLGEVRRVDGIERQEEIARMMGGAEISAAVLTGAREMIEAKANIKRKRNP